MEPDDVWVVYDNMSCMIKHVYPEAWQADRKAEEYYKSPDESKAFRNIDRIEVTTLSKAVKEIRERSLAYGESYARDLEDWRGRGC